MTELVVAIPVLARPERVRPLLESLERGRGEAPYRPLFVASPGDRAELAALDAAGADHLVAPWAPGPGDFARKINLALAATEEPWLFTGADDLCFCPGWADAALACAAAGGAAVGVVGTNDLGNPQVMKGEAATHSLVRRAYVAEHGTIDERGKIFHESYQHNFVDRELVETAKARGAWLYCGASMVEHMHPDWGKGGTDRTYAKGRAGFAQDLALFHRRSRLWAHGRA